MANYELIQFTLDCVDRVCEQVSKPRFVFKTNLQADYATRMFQWARKLRRELSVDSPDVMSVLYYHGELMVALDDFIGVYRVPGSNLRSTVA